MHRDAGGRVAVVTGTHQDITETKLAEIALEDQVRQNALMQAIASAANEAHTLEDVLGQARSLVLLHDDWERARAFVLAEDGAGVVPLYVGPRTGRPTRRRPRRPRWSSTLANRAFRAERSRSGTSSELTIAFPVRYADEVFAVVTITSAPPLYRFDLIQSMVEQVAVQLGRVVERQIAAARARRRPRRRDGGVAAEVGVPRDHEPRDPDPAQRRDRAQRPAAAHRVSTPTSSGSRPASRARAGRCSSLINDILDFSKIEAGKLELERLDFEVRAVFDQVANVLGEAARAKGLELIVSCDPSVPGGAGRRPDPAGAGA